MATNGGPPPKKKKKKELPLPPHNPGARITAFFKPTAAPSPFAAQAVVAPPVPPQPVVASPPPQAPHVPPPAQVFIQHKQVCNQCGACLAPSSSLSKHQASKQCRNTQPSPGLHGQAAVSASIAAPPLLAASPAASTIVASTVNVDLASHYVALRHLDVPEGHPTNLDKEFEDDDQHISVLRRETAELLIQKIDAQKRQAGTRGLMTGGYLLRGAGGTGKSVTLYRLVHHARQSGWMVIYFPKFSALANEASAEMAARRCLQQLSKCERLGGLPSANGKSWLQVAKETAADVSDAKPEKCVDTVRKLMEALRMHTGGSPILLAVDEWNACFHNSCPEFLREIFASIFMRSFENGISVCAVSATWGSVPKEHNFPNADRQELVHELKPYSENEIKLQLARFEQRSRFPTLSEEERKTVCVAVGNVPRLLTLAATIYQEVPSHLYTFKSWMIAFQERAVEIYDDVVKKILHKNHDGEMLAQVARVLLFRNTDPSILTGARWDVAGLFIADKNGLYTTICPPAMLALEKAYCREQQDRILRDLMSANCAGVALELALASAFRNPTGVNWLLEDRAMTGLRRSPARQIRLNIKAGGVIEASCKKIELGSIAILCGNHPVVDYVCHSTSGELFFIQASVSRYSRHKSSYKDLVATPPGGKSVLTDWEDRAWGATPKKNRTPSYYVYITTDPHKGFKDKDNPQVIYVGPEQLPGILKEETVRILLNTASPKAKPAASKEARKDSDENEAENDEQDQHADMNAT